MIAWQSLLRKKNRLPYAGSRVTIFDTSGKITAHAYELSGTLSTEIDCPDTIPSLNFRSCR
jgi:hypothetical protein